ncbi:TapB family protein [Carboxylicivirga marina]|uniref:DUF3108 domain-containing protein n=1 Tax=Carboxylicivirga marina TaxID=2800988 RepID=A0ABS1HMT8_9BACT|nr:hypothetical protein [Carboxylicivirga marina]MBK3518984.1 hypothetical protein [Carboxylicivirga marina]
MKFFLSVALLLLQLTLTEAQDCKAYIPFEKGTISEMTNYDKKGKVVGIVTQHVSQVESKGNTTTFTVHQKFEDPKSKEELVENEMTFKCIDGEFYIDMNGYIDKKQMEAYEGMEVKLSMDEISIPSSYKIGENLKDGYIKMEVNGGPFPINMTVNVVNRLIVAEEELTTPAGTFDCVKISQDIVTKSIVNIKISSVEWYAEGVGVVKTETIKKGKLIG